MANKSIKTRHVDNTSQEVQQASILFVGIVGNGTVAACLEIFENPDFFI